MDELKGLIRDLDGDVVNLRSEAATREHATRRRDRRRDVLLAVLITAVLVAALFIWRFVAQSNCTTDRTKALTGPGNDRVSELVAAFRSSALDSSVRLSAKDRAADITELSHARARYPVIPSDPKLAALPSAQILVYVHAVHSIDADDKYQAALRHHPVCTLWGL